MKKGFTLIEIVVVMAIIAILIGAGVTSYSASLNKARDAQRKADLKIIQTALELYKQDNDSYPATGWVNSNGGGYWIPGLSVRYLKSMPVDPQNIVQPNPPGAPDQPGNYVYGYFSANYCGALNGGDFYILAARLQSISDPDAKVITVSNGITSCPWPPATQPTQPDVYAVSNP